jgi:integrase
MRALREAVQQYLALRGSLGYDLRIPRGILRRFVEFADGEGASQVTTDLVLRWADQWTDVLPSTRASGVGVVRRFAVWQRGQEPRTQVPPAGLVPGTYRRRPPSLHSDEDVVRIVTAAVRLESPTGLRGLTCATVFGLIAVAGLRISEAIKLDRADVDLDQGVLTIRRTKFGKSRIVPLHPTTRRALAQYAAQRDRLAGAPRTPAFFISERRRRITEFSIRYNFAVVARQLGHRPSSKDLAGRRRYRHGRGPRLHDLRHRFAAKTMLDWYQIGADVDRELPKLATYLGHTNIAHTYWYIEAVPELLQLATERVMAERAESRP